jgi:hypothetical protein
MAAGLTGVSAQSTTVYGGNSVAGKVTLDAAAPAGGFAVSLASDTTSVATVPASVTVAAGAKTAAFKIKTVGVAANATVKVTATAGAVSKVLTLTVKPARLSSLLVPASVVGGNKVTGKVMVEGLAPTGGIEVTLSSSNTSVATVPALVTIAAGKSYATFNVSSTPVVSSTQATITATARGLSKTDVLTVKPAGLSKVALSRTTVTGGSTTVVTATVYLTGPAPTGGLVVNLASNNDAATVPATVDVAEGKTTAKFTVSHTSVAAKTTAKISATMSGLTKSANIAVVPPSVSAITVNPTIVSSGDTSTGTVKLNAPAPAGGLTVTLVASPTGKATFSTTVVVAEGAKSKTFTITAGTVTTQTKVKISSGGKFAILTIKP